MGRDTFGIVQTDIGLRFQSTRPRGARPNTECNSPATFRFNPRAHVGRDPSVTTPRGTFTVSIHAPTWGATVEQSLESRSTGFNPRAHVGRDPVIEAEAVSLWCFNPRAHVGRDKQARIHIACVGVSIHAPTWGATSLHLMSPMRSEFQSTRPRGARQIADHDLEPSHSFNPRAHVGRDITAIHALQSGGVSIHAPTWGATMFSAFKSATIHVSIHAPTWGATSHNQSEHKIKMFQSTRPRGARQRIQ